MTSGTSLLERKLRAQAHHEETQRALHNARATHLLVLHYLRSQSLMETLHTLEREAPRHLDSWQLADNVDLDIVLTQWQEHYQNKYGRAPTLCYQQRDQSASSRPKQKPNRHVCPALPAKLPASVNCEQRHSEKRFQANTTLPQLNSIHLAHTSDASASLNFECKDQESLESYASLAPPAHMRHTTGVQIIGVHTKSSRTKQDFHLQSCTSSIPPQQESLLVVNGTNTAVAFTNRDNVEELALTQVKSKNPTLRMMPSDDAFTSIIERDILLTNPNVRWHDIVGLSSAKQLLQEAVVLPLRFPRFFTGLLSPWKGILLHGPPGTGKTMLAKAVATECKTTFFNISSSSITSKYRGDSEKLVRALFALAEYYSPTTIFIDEIDALMSHRDAGGAEEGASEASRRFKSELLIQLDGLATCGNSQIFVLGASNMPWDLDHALLRRLEKRIFVPLPAARGRSQMLRKHLSSRACNVDYDVLAEQTTHYSGADIASVCKESAMRPVRRLMSKLLETNADLSGADIDLDPSIVIEPVSMADVLSAIACTKPTASASDLSRYQQFDQAHGASLGTEERLL